MQEKKYIKLLIIILIIVLTVILFAVYFMLYKEKEIYNYKIAVANRQDLENNIYDDSRVYSDIEELLNSYGAVLNKVETQNNYVIYLNFGKTLVDSDGYSNKKYFDSLVNACAKNLMKKKFYLYDEEQLIKITVECDFYNNNIKYKINDIENYFEKIDLKNFKEIENTKIVDKQQIDVPYNILYKIIQFNMRMIEDLGEEEGTEGKYTIYQNGSIKSRNFSGKVRNIIFTQNYKEEVFEDIKVGTPLEEIANKYPQIAFGSVEDGYLGYRTDDVYVFIYKDEISVYGYSYHEQEEFEKILSDYLNTKDLDMFCNKLIKLWQNYDEFEYNKIENRLYLKYPSMGVIIDIRENDSKGICFYNNFYFTEKIKRYLYENKVSINATKDLLLLSEKNRKEAKN